MKQAQAAALLLTLIVAVFPSASARCLQVALEPPRQGIQYQARCSTDSTEGDVWPLLEVLYCYADSTDCAWSVVARMPLEGLRCPDDIRAISLQQGAASSHSFQVVALSGGGETRRWLHVVEIVPWPTELPVFPRLRSLLAEWHEGPITYMLDDGGRLVGTVLRYTAAHAGTRQPFTGHLLLARNFAWDGRTNSLRAGPFYVDAESERKLTLGDVLVMPGSERLGVKHEGYDSQTRTSIVSFRPVGLLRQKVPAELRSAFRVRAKVRFSQKSDALAPVVESIDVICE